MGVEFRYYASIIGSFTYCGVAIPSPALKGGAKRAKDAKAP